MKFLLQMMLLFILSISNALAAECLNRGDLSGIHVVSTGTFMLSLDNGQAFVSSYLPSGTVVQLNEYKTINYHKTKGRQPIQQCYLNITTSLGKVGYILAKTIEPASHYSGEYVFPRTQIEIFKKPDLETIQDYRSGNMSKSHIVMSSTYPKFPEKLKVVGMDEEQDFFIVTAQFLGDKVTGYLYAEDINDGKAAVIDASHTEFIERAAQENNGDIKAVLKSLLGENVYSELDETLAAYSQDAELEICKIPLSLTPHAEVKLDTWWVSGGLSIESKINIKAENRSYDHESYTIKRNGTEQEIEFVKHLMCDSESMLYPVIIKIKKGNLELKRELFANLGSVYRKNEDPVGGQQFRTMLTIKSYGDWYKVYSHLDTALSNWKGIYGDNYDVLLDILIDSLSYFPPSKKRTVAI